MKIELLVQHHHVDLVDCGGQTVKDDQAARANHRKWPLLDRGIYVLASVNNIRHITLKVFSSDFTTGSPSIRQALTTPLQERGTGTAVSVIHHSAVLLEYGEYGPTGTLPQRYNKSGALVY